MAASMVRSRTLCKLSHLMCKHATRYKSSSSGSYYVLLPEVPPDTPETNALLRLNDFPQFSEINNTNIVTGCAKLALDFETKLDLHLETLSDLKEPKTFNKLFDPIEEFHAPMNFAWQTSRLITYARLSDKTVQAFQRATKQVMRVKNDRWLSQPLYSIIQELAADKQNLEEYQQRLVDMYRLEARLGGIELRGVNVEKMEHWARTMAEHTGTFYNNVQISRGFFSQKIHKLSLIEDMPQHLLNRMAEDKTNPSKGPWKVTLQDQVYDSFIKHCHNRQQRWNAWNARVNIASLDHNEKYLSNSQVMDKIRKARDGFAKIVGYKNFAEVSMETKMAGKVENVFNLLEEYRYSFLPVASEEINSLQDFASSNGFVDELKQWDIPYWRNRQQRKLYGLRMEDMAMYFPLPRVLDGIFSLCNKLFGITFVERQPKPDVVNKDVMVFDVMDEDGSYISSLFLDLFKRSDKLVGGSCECGRDRSDVVGYKPISHIMLDIPPPAMENRPAVLTYQSVLALFHQFGHSLQQMLTTVPHSEVAGQKHVEWDALHLSAYFMEAWAREPSVLHAISGHHETGEPLSDDVILRLIKADKHMFAYDMCFELYRSAFDMEVHLTIDGWWRDVSKTVYENFMPVNLDENDWTDCSFVSVFAENYPAAYYSYIWSQMLAADVFEAFKEGGSLKKEEDMAVLGRRFRSTFLSLGGGTPAGEVFRRFRGRDPSIDCLKHQNGVE